MTDPHLKAEILSCSRSQGLFAGLDLSGGVIKPDLDDNQALYGQGVTTQNILIEKRVTAPAEAAEFVAALKRTAPTAE